MAGAAFYSSRVNPGVVAASAPQAAGGLGEVVSALGRTAGAMLDQNRQTEAQVSAVDAAIAEREAARKRDQTAADVAVKLAQGEGEHARWAIDHQNDADFESKAAAKIAADMAELRGSLGNDPELQQQYAPLLMRTEEARLTAAHERMASVTAKASKDAAELVLTASKNNAMTSPERTGEFADTISTGILANQSIPEALRPLVAHQAAGEVWQSGLEAGIRSGRFKAIGDELNKGTYDAVLPEGAKTGLLRLVDAEASAAAVAARTKKSEEAAKARQAADLIQHAVDAGIDPSPVDMKAAEDLAKAAGLPVEAFDLRVLQKQVAVNRAWRGKSTVERGAAIRELQALQAAGKASADEQLTLDQLVKLNDAKQADEARPLKDLYGQGPGGQRQVAGQIRSLPVTDRYALAEKVDKGFGAYAVLADDVRDVAIAGRADRELVKDHLVAKNIDPVWREVIGGSAEAFSGQALAGVKDVAQSIYAHYARGEARFNPRVFGIAINRALGGRSINGEWRGGAGKYNGHAVLLPEGRSQAEFNAAIDAYDFSGARDLNGAPISKAYVTGTFRPFYLGDSPDGQYSTYAWVDQRGRRVKDARGKDFPFWVKH